MVIHTVGRRDRPNILRKKQWTDVPSEKTYRRVDDDKNYRAPPDLEVNCLRKKMRAPLQMQEPEMCSIARRSLSMSSDSSSSKK